MPLISQDGEFSYLETPQFQAVRLPYRAGRLAMYFFLPDAPSGLGRFPAAATAARWNGWLAKMRPPEMTVSLPGSTPPTPGH